MNSINSMKARFGYDKLSNWGISDKEFDNTMGDKVNVRGKESLNYADPLIRIRENKLYSMKRALYNSYQSAIIMFDKDDRQHKFRCLINHDKLKVDYEDKVLSIPFRQIPVEYEKDDSLTIEQKIVDTGTSGRFLDEVGNPVLDENGEEIYQYRVKPGDTFKWLSGNEGYMPDSYWIIFLQYSEETAYFRGQIRKADDLIQIIPIDEDGEEGQPVEYHGWSTGPNEDQDVWNVKKGVVWNDLYYSKLLYITKDETTEAYFSRFDRLVVNGQTWEVVGFNDNYGTSSKNAEGGIIRVALKETYTSTKEMVKNYDKQVSAAVGTVLGPIVVQTYDVIKYKFIPDGEFDLSDWNINGNAPVKVLSQIEEYNNDTNQWTIEIKLEIGQVTSEKQFTIEYGEAKLEEIKVKPFK